MTEAEIQRAIRLRLAATGKVLLFRNNVGVGEFQGQRVRFGLLRGSSDLIGLIKPSGRFFALEVKRPGKKPTKEQEMFMKLVRSFGGHAACVDSVEKAVLELDIAQVNQ